MLMRLLKWPPEWTPTGLAVCPAHQTAQQQVGLLCETRPGERPNAPAYGAGSFEIGRLGVSAQQLPGEIARWVDRVDADVRTIMREDGTQLVEVKVSERLEHL